MLSEPNCEQESCQDSTILAGSVERYTGAGVLFIRIRGKNNPRGSPCLSFGTREPGRSTLSAGMRDCQTPSVEKVSRLVSRCSRTNPSANFTPCLPSSGE